jgi:LmbE family N-acetylglucosaminyl deacetylase
MRTVSPPVDLSIMAIAAHPDDIESWCGGTLAGAIDGGAAVRLLLVTSGEHGTSDPTVDPSVVGVQREAEARAAAATLGIADVAFLHQPDGEVENTRELRAALVAWIRRWRPQVLFTHDPERPWPPYISHPDHRAVGRATLDAVYPLARDPLALRDIPAVAALAPHAVSTVWLFASAAADVCIDISHTFARKVAARLEHASQTPDPTALPDDWRRRAAQIGAPAGLELAEAFTVLNL